MRISAIIGLVALAVGLGIGVITFANIDVTLTSMKPGMSVTANATIDKVTANTWAAFDLSTITPIIAGATLVLGAVGWLGRSVD